MVVCPRIGAADNLLRISGMSPENYPNQGARLTMTVKPSL